MMLVGAVLSLPLDGTPSLEGGGPLWYWPEALPDWESGPPGQTCPPWPSWVTEAS